MRLFVQDFLTGAGRMESPDGTFGTWTENPLAGLAQLTATLGIHAKQHPQYPELYHFSYDQLESPKAHPIVRECRGLILNSADNWNVVAYPFNRFANFGETWGDTIDWTDVRVQEKVDGSMIILWFYNGTWNVSTKGSPDAGGQCGDFPFTFSELAWKALNQYGIEPSRHLDYRYTYILELTSIYNHVVVLGLPLDQSALESFEWTQVVIHRAVTEIPSSEILRCVPVTVPVLQCPGLQSHPLRCFRRFLFLRLLRLFLRFLHQVNSDTNSQGMRFRCALSLWRQDQEPEYQRDLPTQHSRCRSHPTPSPGSRSSLYLPAPACKLVGG